MSDHISGPRALADPIADITDLYAFPGPSQPQTLVLVMNTLPFAQPPYLFSDGLIYRFRIRPLSPTASNGHRAPFEPSGEETVIDCVFSDPTDKQDGAGSPVQVGTGPPTRRMVRGLRWKWAPAPRVRSDRCPFGSATRKAAPDPGSAPSAVCAGTR